MATQTHYPSFNVMEQKDSWDDHTQRIVGARTEPKKKYEFLTEEEADSLRAICALLADDGRGPIISFIVSHIDSTLHRSIGESQRKYGTPKAQDLVRDGLAALNRSAALIIGGGGRDANSSTEGDSNGNDSSRRSSGRSAAETFAELDEPAQIRMLEQLSQGQLEPISAWEQVPQKPFFQKLLGWTVEAYCSHPDVWSEIGYAGPMYPRGYVRTQLGQLDPWEAKPET